MGAYTRLSLGKDSSGRSLVVNKRTAAMLAVAEKRLGRDLTIVQGSYVTPGTGAAASALTHAAGGVVDIRTWDLGSGVPKVLLVLRQVGFAAWYRTKAQGFDPHIHAVGVGDRSLHPQAAAQVEDYKKARNGLANHGRDDGPRVSPRSWELVKRRVELRRAAADLKTWQKTHTATGAPRP